MEDIINIGKRRELFWDDYMIDKEKTKTKALQHEFAKQECVLKFEGPLGGDDCHILSLLDDGDKFRMYVHCSISKFYKERTCDNSGYVYAESTDGIHWDTPALGQRELYGNKDNCYLFPKDKAPFDKGLDGFVVMKDTNPACKAGEEYKATAICDHKLMIFTSSDAIHFTQKYVMTADGQYDSNNTLMFDEKTGRYRCYYRVYHPDNRPDTIAWRRDIRVSESEDLVNWSKPYCINFDDYMDWQLYMNGISKYRRAPHIFVGFPTRYVERGKNEWQTCYEALKNPEQRLALHKAHGRAATAMSDSLFMVSRNGIDWKRYNEPILTAGPENGINWVYGSAYLSNIAIETKSRYKGCDNELSMFAGENRWSGKPGEIYRYTMRLDGFVSQHAAWDSSWSEPAIVTKPFIYDGSELFINFATSAYGGIQIDLRSLSENREINSAEIFGDATDRKVMWLNGSPAEFAGQPVVMTFHMHDADVWSFRFA